MHRSGYNDKGESHGGNHDEHMTPWVLPLPHIAITRVMVIPTRAFVTRPCHGFHSKGRGGFISERYDFA